VEAIKRGNAISSSAHLNICAFGVFEGRMAQAINNEIKYNMVEAWACADEVSDVW
jgi:hypothetical protein